MAEVELGRLATQRAGDASVREFGARMVADHSRANSELKSIAGQKGIQLPTELSSEQKSEMGQVIQNVRRRIRQRVHVSDGEGP
jgi:putative membrane protein